MVPNLEEGLMGLQVSIGLCAMTARPRNSHDKREAAGAQNSETGTPLEPERLQSFA